MWHIAPNASRMNKEVLERQKRISREEETFVLFTFEFHCCLGCIVLVWFVFILFWGDIGGVRERYEKMQKWVDYVKIDKNYAFKNKKKTHKPLGVVLIQTAILFNVIFFLRCSLSLKKKLVISIFNLIANFFYKTKQ